MFHQRCSFEYITRGALSDTVVNCSVLPVTVCDGVNITVQLRQLIPFGNFHNSAFRPVYHDRTLSFRNWSKHERSGIAKPSRD